jgi:spoIIIJ-associated protein
MEANETLNAIIKELLRKLGFESEIYERKEEGRTVFNIRTSDAQLLIGKQGANLEALQFVVRLLFRRKMGEERFPFAVDIDDYKDKRVLYLKDLARKAAHHVKDTKKPVALEPMPSHERRVVHAYLALYADISSESTGVEPNRKIIIRLSQRPKQSGDDFKFIENS